MGRHDLTGLGSNDRDEKEPPRAALDGEIGDAVLFDIRLEHRGTANKGQTSRSIAYMSYVNAFWTDDVNFKARFYFLLKIRFRCDRRIEYIHPNPNPNPNSNWRQTSRWDNIESMTRRQIFRRLDAQDYTRRLEVILAQEIGDERAAELLRGLKSRATYSQVSLELA